MSGDLDYVAFSYGLYFAITFSWLLRGRGSARGWLLTGFLGLLPAFFHFFPIFSSPADAHWESWPLNLAVLGGLLIGFAAFLLMVTAGRVLGVSTFWRRILEPNDPKDRFVFVLFFVGFLLGGIVAFNIEPQAFAAQPPPHNLLLRFLGGLCVAIGTDLANGCTSGHGVCGVPRLSIRSIVAVASFMASVFLCKIIFDQFI